MPQGIPAWKSYGDLLQVGQSGAFEPAGFVLAGSYTFTQPQIINPTGIQSTRVGGANQALSVIGGIGQEIYAANAIQTQFVAEGSISAPAMPASTRFLCGLRGSGWTSSATWTNRGQILMTAAEAWGAGAQGTMWAITGTLVGTTTTAEWLRISDGKLIQWTGAAPAANTFAGNLLAGRNNAQADTAGFVGETTNSKISTATNAAATGTYLALTSLTLAAGKWRIAIYAEQVLNGATLTAAGSAEALVGTTSASNAGTTAGYDRAQAMQPATGVIAAPICLTDIVVNITAATTYFLNVLATFTAGTPQWRGSLKAERLA